MTLRVTFTGLIAGLALPMIFAADANADHRRHWFFDSYGQYEAEAYETYVPRRRFRQRRRRPVVVYEEPLFPGDELLEEEYLEQRANKKRRWRKRRVRYDLAPNTRKQRLREGLRRERVKVINVPKPRYKPLADDSISTASISPLPLSPEPEVLPVETKSKIAARPRKSSDGRVNCAQAKAIVTDFGFSDVKAKNCDGSSYDFAAKRDGKPFTITLSAANGELTDVKRN